VSERDWLAEAGKLLFEQEPPWRLRSGASYHVAARLQADAERIAELKALYDEAFNTARFNGAERDRALARLANCRCGAGESTAGTPDLASHRNADTPTNVRPSAPSDLEVSTPHGVGSYGKDSTPVKYAEMRDRIRDLESQLAAAREDSERLDEYERRIADGWGLEDWRPAYSEVYFRFESRDGVKDTPAVPTLRDACDAARRERSGEGT